MSSFSFAYSQEISNTQDIDEAIKNVNKLNYGQAIPVLKKYSDMQGFDDLRTFEINVYLNACYLVTENKLLDANKVNTLADAYMKKYGISKNDTLKSDKEMFLFYYSGIINSNLRNYEKMVLYYSLITEHYEENNIKYDKAFSNLLNSIAQGYLNLKDYKSALETGQKAWDINRELFGERNKESLDIIEILYACYNNSNEDEKCLEFILKYVDISKAVLGEKSSEYLSSLVNLTKLYFKLGEYSKALEINILVVDYCEKTLDRKDPSYLTALSNLALNYSYLGDYQKSLEINLNVVELERDTLGEKHPYYLTTLGNLANDYLYLGDYSKALEIQKNVVEIGKEILGEKNTDYLRSLNNLSQVYTNLGDFQKAFEIDIKVVERYKEVLGEKHPYYITSLGNLAQDYLNLGNSKKALEIQKQVVEISNVVLGEKHPEHLRSLNNLSQVYANLGDYQKAFEIDINVVELYKEVLGEKHPSYITSLGNLAQDYLNLGLYQKALETQLKAASIGKELFGEKHPDYLGILNNLSQVYTNLGDYQKGFEIDINVVELYKEVLGERHPSYITSLGNLANDYLYLGFYQKALETQLKAVSIGKEFFGEKHPDYLRILSNLSQVYAELGDYHKALEINLEAVEIGKVVLGEKHPSYLTFLKNLALIYSDIGDYNKSLEINLKVVELKKQILGEKHPSYLVSLECLASVYSDIGDYEKALEINLNVTELAKEVITENAPDYLGYLNNLARTYSDLGENQKALEMYIKNAELTKEVLGEKHPKYISRLNNQAMGYSDLGNYKKAIEYSIKTVEIAKEVLGDEHPAYLDYLNNLAMTEFKSAEFDSALFHKRQVAKKIQKRTIAYFNQLTENQRELFWNLNGTIGRYSTLIAESSYLNNPESASYIYDLLLFTKGILLNTTLDFDKLIAEKGTTEAIAKYDELKILKLEIQRLTEKPIAERYLNVDTLENIAQQKETELVKLSKEYGDYTGNLKINWKDVQAKLQDKDVAIEFVEYPTLTDTVKYAALVLRKGWQYPRMISLFRKDQVDDFIKQDKDIIYSKYVGKELKKLLWDPLEHVVSPGERVYFSPAGIIHQLAIENLPFDDSTTLGDRYQMYRLSSTKELALQKTESKSNIAALYGGLQYDLPEEKMMAESKKYEMLEPLYAMRGYTNDTAVRSGWKYLDGTKPEVDKISKLMKEKHYQVDEYTGETGNEESFKSLSGKKEDIIHIATHGFFLPIEESKKNNFVMQRMGDQQKERATVDPMLRSGLIMAGGNKAWQGEKIPDNIEDGVLTAKEISRMDLRGTDLVVLSACETGLGEVSSEGVFGLQRSFKQAGVQTLVMSLWQVNDEATRYLMTEFYSELLSGKDKRAAFLEAKQKCKVKYTEPRYWAAFIMLD